MRFGLYICKYMHITGKSSNSRTYRRSCGPSPIVGESEVFSASEVFISYLFTLTFQCKQVIYKI
jgi:hypothetical protein